MSEEKRRGFDPDDSRFFSNEELAKLYTAQEDIQWLLDRGYKTSPVTEFTGNHYQLASRQRTALQRSTSAKLQYESRKKRELPLEAAKEGCIYIDGFNLIITLEVALSGSLVILGKDGVLRDLAGLRGTYSLIGHTDEAILLIGDCLKQLSVPKAVFYLDSPVSNSGRLRNRILEYSSGWDMPIEVELVPNADVILSKLERVVTGDSIILDQCTSWFNLSRKIIGHYIKTAWILNLNNEKEKGLPL